MGSIEGHTDRMRIQYTRKWQHADVNQGPGQSIRDSQLPNKDAVYKSKYEFYKKRYLELKLRYEILSKDAKNRELALSKDIKEMESKAHEDIKFFDDSMDEVKKRHKEEIRKVSKEHQEILNEKVTEVWDKLELKNEGLQAKIVSWTLWQNC